MHSTRNRSRVALAVVATLLTAASANGAYAQSQAGDDLALQEVVVTARKSQERLLDVPLAITAISAEAIEQKGIRNLDDVAAATPGLTFSDVQAGFLPVPVIRGFAPIDVRGENNAAVFVDGVFISGKEGLNYNQTDLERIEVIKGPQAALYGRNSFSGAINYVTARPSDVVKAKAEIQMGSSGKRAVSGSWSGPLIEGTLKGRIAVSYDNFDGSYNNQYSGLGGRSNIGGFEYQSAQGTLLWTPADSFEAQLQAYISNDVVGNSAISPVTANCENTNSLLSVQSPAPPAGYLNYCGTFQAVGRDGLSAIPQATGNKRDVERANLNITWKTGIGTISSLTGYSKVGQGFLVDGSRNSGETVPFVYIAKPASGLATLVPGTFYGGEQKVVRTGLLQIGGGGVTEEISTELRLSSDTEQKLRWAIGGYFYETKSHGGNDGVKTTQPLPADFYAFCLSCRSAAAFGRATLIYDPANDPAATGGVDTTGFKNWFVNPTGDAIFSDTYRNKVSANSAFASLEYDFTEAVKGRIEGRYTDEKKAFKNLLTARSGDKSWGLKNWRATLDYKPNRDTTIYGSYAHAEKSGNLGSATVVFVSDTTAANVPILTSFDPEKNNAFELGMKQELANGRVYIDLDIYQSKWKDIVIPQIRTEVVDPRSGAVSSIRTPTAFNVNAGDATLRGAEFSLNARVTDRIDTSFGISYNDSKYDRAKVDSFKNYPSFSPTGDISGKKLMRTSPWQMAASLGYTAPLADNKSWYLRGDLSYRDKQFADPTNEALTPSQTKLNMSLGLQAKQWTIELWGRNLTNEDGASAAYRDVYFGNALADGTFFRTPTGTTPAGSTGKSTFFPWRYSVSYPTLREYGLTARYKF